MTSHFPSASLRFRNTDIAPFCYAIEQNAGQIPSKISSYFLNGQAVVVATFADGRGACNRPVEAEFVIPVVKEDGSPTGLDTQAGQGAIRRFEEDIFGTGEELVTPTRLTTDMLRGLLVGIDQHIKTDPSRSDPSNLGAVVDSGDFRNAIFSIAMELSDLGRNGQYVSRGIVPATRTYGTLGLVQPGETQVEIAPPARFAMARV